ncbi:MAG: hypothetical protein EI684_13025 [Candidatus Viridilinea halotolerans]|uniref:Uncharacterized protein n=1 Tax=Candidatus Viridilinea halotolerans TaxID=2491704 RepID=A0A426TY47_9CHLR|nr:MAG: hypothetical protein EI684_13025 [Candidatus Viridilinea halotolerans]
MRKEFSKALRTSFSKKMQTLVPQFHPEKVTSSYCWPGERAFCNRIDESLCCWIVLSPSPKDYDEFTLLLGWSIYGKYPETGVVPLLNLPTPDHKEFAQPEYLMRLPQLWTESDPWWVIKPFTVALTSAQLQASLTPLTQAETEVLVLPQVEAAFGKLLEVGLPYLAKYVAFRGGAGAA